MKKDADRLDALHSSCLIICGPIAGPSRLKMPRFPHKQRVFSPSPVLSRLIPSFSNTLSPYSKAGIKIPFLERVDKLIVRQISIDIKSEGYIPPPRTSSA